uniref:PepSY-like domain-containing protein n=1 Tax=Mariniflexile sp. TaxID=1979402 RepID=UPI004048BE1B
MKTTKTVLLSLMIATSLLSCTKNDPNATPNGPTNANLTASRADNAINVATLPQAVLDYIATNHTSQTIATSGIEDNGNYEVTLNNGIELIFEANGTFLGIDDDSNDTYGDTDINPAELPQNILDYMLVNYPNHTISEAELENNGNYEIVLNDATALVFDGGGTFLGVDVDQDDHNGNNDNDNETDDNDQVVAPSTLPQIILDYISTNYPSEMILQAKIEGGGGYEVTLNNGLEIHFDSNGNFTSTGNGDDDGDGNGD